MPQPDADRSRDDRFDDLLHASLQSSDDDEPQNLDLAEEDALDLAEMREAIGNYRAETLRFAEQQSAGMPVPRAGGAAALWHRTPRWALASAAVLTLGCTSFVLTHRSSQPVPVALAAAPTASALLEDNRLLLSVNQALNESIAPTEQQLGLSAIPAHSTKRGRSISN